MASSTINRDKTPLDLARQHFKPVIAYAAVMGFFINLLILPMSLYSLQIYDRVMSTGSLPTLLWLTVIMLLIFAAVGALQTLRGNVLSKAGEWLYITLSEAAIPQALTYLSSSKDNKNIQSLRDAGMLRQFINGTGLSTIMDTPWAILYIGVLFILHYSLGLLVLAGSCLLVLLAWLNESATHEAITESGLNQIKSLRELEIAAHNADVVESMGMTHEIVSRWRNTQAMIASTQEAASSHLSLLQGSTRFLRLSLQILVTALAAWLALQNAITFGGIIASSILANRALAPFEAVITSWRSFIEARDAYARLQTSYKNPTRNEGISLPAPEGRLSVESLTYIPQGVQRPTVRNISFSLNYGDIVGVVGPSGSGKTTLARLILGTWKPTAGIVRLDDADVYSWPRAEFGKYVGYMPQDVELFGGTVKENIARLTADAPDEAIVEAAQLAGAHELILRLPNGYSTEIGAGGELLSAGQRQRIALARAFYGSPRLLVLDEPDSNLDDAGQLALTQALKQARALKITVLVITHRKAILSHVDKILYLKDASIEAFGNARDVLTKLSPAPVAIPKVNNA